MSFHAVIQLGDIAKVVAGDPAPQDPGAFAADGPLFVRMQDVGLHHVNRALTSSADRLCSNWLERNRLRVFPKDSVLIPKSGASVNLNHRAKLATDAHVVSHLAVVMPDKEKVDPDYLFWWSVRYDPRAQAQVTSLPSLKLSTLREALVPLPPLDEQRRIVGILNRAAKIELLRAKAQELLREFVPALFVKMFGDPVENPMAWPTERLGHVIKNGPQNGLYKPKSAYGSGTLILRIDGFYDGSVTDPASWKRLRLDDTTLNKYMLMEDDIVINRVNSRPFLGKSAVIPKIREPAVFESNMMRMRIDANRMLPHFLISMLQLETVRNSLNRNAKDAINQSSINQTDVRGLLVIVPPLHLQHQYAQALSVMRSILAVAQFGDRIALELSTALLSRLLDGDG